LVQTTTSVNDIENEIIIGLAGGLGVNFDEVSQTIGKALEQIGYHVVSIKIADSFAKRNNSSLFAECYWKMQYGTKQRQIHGNDVWARKAVEKIFYLRPELSFKYKRIAYIVRSLKNKEEIELLSNIYGRNFIALAIFNDDEASQEHVEKKCNLKRLSLKEATKQMQDINNELQLNQDIDLESMREDGDGDLNVLIKFLLAKDEEETHKDLKKHGQNLFKCYSIANYFLYQNKKLSAQIRRFVDILFDDPFAEPTFEEYFMFCAQATAYRSLDLDRQVGAVIVNRENELLASGFNDVCKVGGGHFAHHDHPMLDEATQEDQRDFKQPFDFNHIHLDKIAAAIADKLHLPAKDQLVLREEISGITEFKRSTHAEMSALLDAARRGIAVRDCTMYVNTYPCHNCTKHIIAAGIKKVIFLHPYPKSKARNMYKNMIAHGLFLNEKQPYNAIVFEPFWGASPNRFMQIFAHSKDDRLERVDGKETGKPAHWLLSKNATIKNLATRPPHSYISREWVIVHNKSPDISVFYKPGFIG